MSTAAKNLHIFSHAIVIFLFSLYVACTVTNPNAVDAATGISVASGVISACTLLGFAIAWLGD